MLLFSSSFSSSFSFKIDLGISSFIIDVGIDSRTWVVENLTFLLAFFLTASDLSSFSLSSPFSHPPLNSPASLEPSATVCRSDYKKDF